MSLFWLVARWVLGSLPNHEPYGAKTLEGNVSPILAQFGFWDGAHYLSIAKNGHTYPGSQVFGLGYPWAIRAVRECMLRVGAAKYVEFDNDLFILAGLLVSLASFQVARRALASVGRSLGHSPQRIDAAMACFSLLNPAAVFFSAVYTESFYAALAWTALALMIDGQTIDGSGDSFVSGSLSHWMRRPCAAVLFFCASHVRTTGSFNTVLCIAIAARSGHALFETSTVGTQGGATKSAMVSSRGGVALAAWNTAWAAACAVACLLPLHLWGPAGGLTYVALQAEHWNVGLLRQYQVRQLPNFLLALPTFGVVAHTTYKWWVATTKATTTDTMWRVLFRADTAFVIHFVLLTAVVLLVAHPQVLTRVAVAGSPWYFFALTDNGAFDDLPAEEHGAQRRLQWLWCVLWSRPRVLYTVCYAVVGTALHANNFPIT